MAVALVTGASRGLGAASAMALAADGFAVAVNYAHDNAGAAGVVAKIRAAGGVAEAFCFDVTSEEEVKAGVAAITGSLGAIDVVVNNAIGSHGPLPVEDQSWDLHLAQLKFCVKAPLQILQTLVADWKSRKKGTMINIGSEVVHIGNPNFSHYMGAKAAMIGLTRSWATELGPFGIRVNLVEPGFIPVERHRLHPPMQLEGYRRNVPLGHMGEPADIAAMVAFLASPRAKFITGQTYAVNGGRTLT